MNILDVCKSRHRNRKLKTPDPRKRRHPLSKQGSLHRISSLYAPDRYQTVTDSDVATANLSSMEISECSAMSGQSNVLRNPLVHYGLPAVNAVIILAVGFLFLDPGITRNVLFLVVAVEITVVPWVLKRAGRRT